MECHSYSRELRHAAREVEMMRHSLKSALDAVLIDELELSVSAIEEVKPIPSVELPEIPANTRTLSI